MRGRMLREHEWYAVLGLNHGGGAVSETLQLKMGFEGASVALPLRRLAGAAAPANLFPLPWGGGKGVGQFLYILPNRKRFNMCIVHKSQKSG